MTEDKFDMAIVEIEFRRAMWGIGGGALMEIFVSKEKLGLDPEGYCMEILKSAETSNGGYPVLFKKICAVSDLGFTICYELERGR